jgi:hypothetical protein
MKFYVYLMIMYLAATVQVSGKKKEVGKGDLPMPDASCCGVEARKRYMPRITSAKRKAILEIVPYCVLKNPSAPSLMASDI